MKERLKISLLTVFTFIGVWIISPSTIAYALVPHNNDNFGDHFVLTYTQMSILRLMSVVIPVLLIVFGILWITKMCKARRNNLVLRIIGVIVLQLGLCFLLEIGILLLAMVFANTAYSSGGLGMTRILGETFYYYID